MIVETQHWTYTCDVCGNSWRYDRKKRPELFTCCAGSCRHLGPILKTIPADVLDCGCGAIRVHRCWHHSAPVTRQTITDDHRRVLLADLPPEATLPTCHGCPAYSTGPR